MIICVSANPAIDRRLCVERLAPGAVNRAHLVEPAPGGKAAHVAMAARALGQEVVWVGFLGGATGEECERGLRALGVPVVAVRTRSATRINLEIIDAAGAVTEVLEPGGEVEPDELAAMFAACEAWFTRGGTGAQVALAGSLPPGVPTDFYARLIGAARAYGCRTLLDTSGEALLAGLAARPDFVKPNRQEAESALGAPVRDEVDAGGAARWMIARGARGAAVSLGADGLLWQEGAGAAPILARPPAVAVRSTVGCGDASVAGFAVAAARALAPAEAARLAAACGAANCLAPAPGRITAAEVERLAPMVTIISDLEVHL